MIEQYSEAWFAARCGKATASRIPDLTARTKTGWGASRANYMSELIIEHLTGKTADSYVSPAMQWGIDNEEGAKDAYAFFTDDEIEPCGFVIHPKIGESGASPDGLIGAQGLIEIKCPNTATHIDTLLNETVPTKYIKQMQWQMACTGRTWCDFVSFDPRLPPAMQLWVKHIERDQKLIDELTDNVTEFLQELHGKLHMLRAKYERGERVTKSQLKESLGVANG